MCARNGPAPGWASTAPRQGRKAAATPAPLTLRSGAGQTWRTTPHPDPRGPRDPAGPDRRGERRMCSFVGMSQRRVERDPQTERLLPAAPYAIRPRGLPGRRPAQRAANSTPLRGDGNFRISGSLPPPCCDYTPDGERRAHARGPTRSGFTTRGGGRAGHVAAAFPKTRPAVRALRLLGSAPPLSR
jgi:hypothetical protein